MKRRYPITVLLCCSYGSLGLGLLLVPAAAHAGSDPPGAQALFNEAKKLIADGRWADACPKLEESQKLDPGIGTEFNLANCYEHTGRSASAWATFLNVAGDAKAASQPAREKVARDRAAALEGKLAKLVITVRASDASTLKVTRDALEVGRGQWGTPLPIDTGEHQIVASAPGKKTWEKTVRVPVDGVSVQVEIPALQDDPGAAPMPVGPSRPGENGAVAAAPVTDTGPSAAPNEHPGRTQRTVGAVVGAVGIVGIGVGTAFGLMSRSKRDEADSSHCNADNRCDAAGLSLRDDALHNGTYSTIAFAVGGAALVGGIVLFVTAPKAPSRQTGWHAAPMVGPGATGFNLQARW